MKNLQTNFVNWRACLGAMMAILSICSGTLGAAEAKKPVLIITGAVKKGVELTVADLRAMERVKTKATDRDGKELEFEGVRLWDLIQKSLLFDAREHKQIVNTCVVVKAEDGYQAVFSLAEICPAISDKTVVLADQCDGKALPEADGILRIVVPGEKMRSRWVRQVKELEIVSMLSQNKVR